MSVIQDVFDRLAIATQRQESGDQVSAFNNLWEAVYDLAQVVREAEREATPPAPDAGQWLDGYRWALTHLNDEGVINDAAKYLAAGVNDAAALTRTTATTGNVSPDESKDAVSPTAPAPAASTPSTPADDEPEVGAVEKARMIQVDLTAIIEEVMPEDEPAWRYRYSERIASAIFDAGYRPTPTSSCFCGHSTDRDRVHRAQACEPWSSPTPPADRQPQDWQPQKGERVRVYGGPAPDGAEGQYYTFDADDEHAPHGVRVGVRLWWFARVEPADPTPEQPEAAVEALARVLYTAGRRDVPDDEYTWDNLPRLSPQTRSAWLSIAADTLSALDRGVIPGYGPTGDGAGEA